MRGTVVWESSPSHCSCRVCGADAIGTIIARVSALALEDRPLRRCLSCGSIDILDTPIEVAPDQRYVDDYVEAAAGLGAILDTLRLIDTGRVRRFLDVGCGYGFAVDMGERLFGWDAVGVEPGIAGPRGAAELGCDIRSGYVEPGRDLGEAFDLVLASEVLEHVTSPVRFLIELRDRLTDDGTLILTTPAAETVRQDNGTDDVLAALSPGFHAFVASEHGLRLLLARAGFPHVTVWRDGATLRAIARLHASSTATVPARRPEPTDPLLERYLIERGRDAAPGSSLSLGMSTRLLRRYVARGAWPEALALWSQVSTGYAARIGVLLDDVALAQASLDLGPERPCMSLGGSLFARGMIALSHEAQPGEACVWFDLASRALDRWHEWVVVIDLDTADLELQAPYHAALAAARHDAAEALERIGRMTLTPARLARVFVELVVRDNAALVKPLVPRIAAVASGLAWSSPAEDRRAGVDALYALGIVALQTGAPDVASRWFEQCHAAARASGQSMAAMVEIAAAHVRIASGQTGDVSPSMEIDTPAAELHHHIDTYWCDASSIFMAGWVVMPGRRVDAIALRVGDMTTQATLHDREDLTRLWSEPDVSRGGFRVMHHGSPHGAVRLEVVAGTDTFTIPLTFDGPRPARAATDHDTWESLIRQTLELAPAGPVLFVGMRQPDSVTVPDAERLAGSRPWVGVDIHPGPGVTVIGDAHALSTFLEPDSFAAVISGSVLEHLEAPWIAALEMGRVLRTGGLALQVAPWVWPTHSEPNDFWRMSPEGLRVLFGPRTGFEPLRVFGGAPAVVIPEPNWRGLNAHMPTTVSGSMSGIISRKVAPTPSTWPAVDDSVTARARAYPVSGVVTPDAPRC